MFRLLFHVLIGIILLSPALSPSEALAQAGKPAEKVELLGSDSLAVLNTPGQEVRQLFNNVRFRHKGALMYADRVIQNVTTNVIEAYGNVRLVQGDTINLRGDTMYYYGNTRQANMRGHVIMRDRKMTLTTAHLDYDMVSGIAHYPPGAPDRPGRIVDKENVLTSREGYYDTRTKLFTFRQNVRLVNPKGTLTADSLLYNSNSRIATFQGPTRIVNKDGVLTAIAGQYNTTTGISNFQRRATVETPKYRITGDSLYYDNVADLGIADGNVIMVAKDKKAVITGDHVRYNGKVGISRVVGHPVAKTVASQQDTLYLRADTLFSFDNKVTNTRRLLGQKNVFVFKSDLQSKCDSLIYDTADSTIYFYKKPIVWSQNKYQMEADSMRALLKNNRIHTMFMKTRSFIISLDTLQNFNQVKGRVITAYFGTKPILVADSVFAGKPVVGKSKSTTATNGSSDGVYAKTTTAPQSTTAQQETKLERVIVEGNGQSIYYALDDKNKMIGLNHVECSKMNLEFTDNKVGQIRFYGRPDAQLVPPKEFTEDKQQLDGFRWRDTEKPNRAQVLWQEIPPAGKPAAKKPAKFKIPNKPLGPKPVQIDAR